MARPQCDTPLVILVVIIITIINFQFCDVATLVIIHKRNSLNLAMGQGGK
jgi:hypothetical protein